MNLGTLIGMLPLLGLAAGLLRWRYPRLPIVAAGVVVVLYLLYVASTGVWAATCWDCSGLGQTRGEVFLVSLVLFGSLAALTLLGVWLGARFSLMLGRLLRTARELRDSARR